MKFEPAPTLAQTATPQFAHASLAAAQAASTAREYVTYDTPPAPDMPIEDTEIIINGERMSVTRLTFKYLTVSEERKAYQRAGADADKTILMAQHLTMEALAFIAAAPVDKSIDEAGDPIETVDQTRAIEFSCSSHDGTVAVLFSAMRPAMRALAMYSFADYSNPTTSSAAVFLKSRKAITR